MPSLVPEIVATQALTGQTSDLAETLYTPTAAGLFRVSLYGELDSSGTIHVTYTDDASNPITLTAGGSGTTKNLSAVFRSGSSQAIGVTTAMDTFPFDLYVTLESLQ